MILEWHATHTHTHTHQSPGKLQDEVTYDTGSQALVGLDVEGGGKSSFDEVAASGHREGE